MPRTEGKKLINDFLTGEMTGFIYKLSYGDDFYIGSTLRPLKKRLHDHKVKCKTGNCKLYQFIRKVGFENLSVEILETVKYKEKKDVRIRELYFYNLLKPSLNEIAPYQSLEDKKIKTHQRWKKWYYDPDNHEKQKAKKREDYMKTRQKGMKKLECECGRIISNKHLKQHLVSNIHIDNIHNLQKQQVEEQLIEDEIAAMEQHFLEEPNLVELTTRIKCDELEEVNLDELCI